MTDTPNLGLPFIEGGQAQKHVTHNEALRMLDAAIQIAVLDITRTAPPASPAAGQRHVVAAGAGGAWAGQAQSIATWQDGAWAFLAPHEGWCIWSVADAVMMVFDGSAWRDLRDLAVDNVPHLGINATADSSNRLSVKSNAALLAAINVAGGGSGDVRLQLSKESAAKTASVVFADNYSGRAEFGLIGTDAFRLKVSPDGSSFIEAFAIDQSTGNLTLPRGVTLSGVIAPLMLTANQNDYAPAGIATACVLQISADAARSVSGLASGAEGRVVILINTGSQPVTLLDDSASSTAANRFAVGGNLTLAGRQSVVLRYDSSAARWQAIAGGLSVRADTAQALTASQKDQASANLGTVRAIRTQKFTASGTYTPDANLLYAVIECIGGGGGGAGTAISTTSNTVSGGGGGAGSYSRRVVTAATLGASQTITIGAAGAGGAAGDNVGTNGGDTSVGSICIAKGGSGGPLISARTGGLGGVQGTGDITGNGEAGGASNNIPVAFSGPSGGATIYGSGGRGGFRANGENAVGYGAGGAGGSDFSVAASRSGGTGAPGIVFIEEYCSK